MMLINYFKKYPYALAMIGVMLLWMAVNGLNAKKIEDQLASKGIYSLARITNTKGSSSGRWVEVHFNYNGKQYQVKRRNQTIPISWIGEKIFIRFLPSDPFQVDYLEHITVPDSLRRLEDPIWQDLPVDTIVH